MKIGIDYIVKQIEMGQLIECQKVEQVKGYCENCNNYDKNHSCPNFDFSVVDYVKEFKYASLIMTVIDGDTIRPHLSVIKEKEYSSRVYDNYKKENMDTKDPWSSMFSMYVFNTVKDDMTNRLLQMEREGDLLLSLPPGSCTKCKTCLKKIGMPCVDQDNLRYSLEALGFLVSDIYETFFDLKMTWSDGDLPDAFRSISAVLSNEPLDMDLIEKHLNDLELAI